jgi:hypothetical protein
MLIPAACGRWCCGHARTQQPPVCFNQSYVTLRSSVIYNGLYNTNDRHDERKLSSRVGSACSTTGYYHHRAFVWVTPDFLKLVVITYAGGLPNTGALVAMDGGTADRNDEDSLPSTLRLQCGDACASTPWHRAFAKAHDVVCTSVARFSVVVGVSGYSCFFGIVAKSEEENWLCQCCANARGVYHRRPPDVPYSLRLTCHPMFQQS